MTKKQIPLNAFNMNCVGHINHGLWTHPRDTSTAYKTLDYWTHLARLLERGLFDGLFLADIVGVYDVPGLGRPDPARIHPAAGQRPAADRAGHGGGYAPPGLRRHRQPDLRDAPFAGAPLLHAGPPDPGPRGLEHRHRLPGERRAPWAVRADRARRALRPRRRIPGRGLSAVGRQLGRGRGQGRQARAGHADPAAVRRVDHDGKYYRVAITWPSQRTPVLYQAGSSGRAWPSPRAMRNACLFPAKPGAAQAGVRAARGGRARPRHRVMGITAVVGRNGKHKHAEYCATPAQRLAWRTMPAPPASIFPPTRRTSRSAT